ncbi:hypothetical protein ACO2Q8_22470 [Larkinella sp. VNQ87]|uniref:hypothetical protein n=1 Tax=Larkinella sp. VNQ87 TaxID=3400921 RepID=UPI003C00EC9D
MNRFGFVLSLLFLLAVTGQRPVLAQASDGYRWELSTGGSALRLSDVAPTGWFLRQQVTYFPHKNIGFSAGVSWGKLDNPAPLQAADRRELLNLFYQHHNATELNVVLAPLRSRRHTVRVSAGLAFWRLRVMTVDSVYTTRYPIDDQTTIRPAFSDSRRVVPQVGLGYQVNLTPRWLLGLEGRAYRLGPAKTATTLGLTAAYRFRLHPDSLGLTHFNRQNLKVGLRVGATHSTENGRSPSERYRTRLVGGVWAELPISLTWSARGEISYAQRGYRVDNYRKGNLRYLPAVSSENFLDWTLLFSHEVAYHWRLFAGPQLALFLNGQAEVDGKPSPVRPRNFSGIVVGTAVQLADRWQLDGRYQRDVLSFSTNQGGGLHGFQLGINYLMN